MARHQNEQIVADIALRRFKMLPFGSTEEEAQGARFDQLTQDLSSQETPPKRLSRESTSEVICWRKA